MILTLVISVIAVIINGVSADDEFDGQLILQVQHSLGSEPDSEFIPRGTITVRSLKTGSLQLPQEVGLSEAERSKLMDLVEVDGFYRIRVPVKTENSTNYVSTFLRACSLYESELRETLILHTDSSGDLVGISVSTPTPQCQGIHISPSSLQYFDTVVEVRPIESGPAPDTAAFIQKVEKEKQDKDRNDQSDNRSFLAKYWMYILPVVIFFFISNLGNPEGQGGGGR